MITRDGYYIDVRAFARDAFERFHASLGVGEPVSWDKLPARVQEAWIEMVENVGERIEVEGYDDTPTRQRTVNGVCGGCGKVE
jgi:hypothetical protein